MELLLPANTARLVPDWFSTRLTDTDRNLICYFNEFKQRWIIDRCSRDGVMSSNGHTHDSSCPRTNVMVVNDAGKYMPLCDEVIDQIRAMDTWSKYGSAGEFKASNLRMEADHRAKADKEMYDINLHAGLDNKIQLQKALDLIARHDVLRVNQ